ncbi:MAG: alpha-hydroxy-acid oxidizing protein [Schwartzia sp.]|nr:alpha-hydroxy-acid oxidizing protein [Schwartzia sp. (in: firmicutes)]
MQRCTPSSTHTRCRPFVVSVFGGGAEGIQTYIDKLAGELEDTMSMCGATSLAEITPDMIRLP